MMKNWIYFFLVYWTFASFGQEIDQKYKHLLTRGKLFYIGVIEDRYITSANAGLEYRFAPRHSFGADFVLTRWHYEYDVYVNGEETGSGPDAYSRRIYFLADYRFYPLKEISKKTGWDPYINPFVKFGKRKIWTNDLNTFFSDDDFSSIRSQRGDFNEYGFSLGLQYGFGKRKRIGIDVNFGFVYRDYSINHEEKYDKETDTLIERNSGNHFYWKPHMRLNVFYKFWEFY